MVGYRSSVKDRWDLSPLTSIQTSCGSSVDGLATYFYIFFFDRYKFQALPVDTNKLNEPFGGAVVPINEYYIDHPTRYKPESYRWKYIGYNLGDPDFWTKALIWHKGARLKGFYSFEYVYSTGTYHFPPTVVYPDSITRLYQRPER